MAIKKVQKNRLNENNEFDVIHYETEASVVLMEDGMSVEEKFKNLPTPDDMVTAEGGATMTMEEVFGEGPYTIEFTEETDEPVSGDIPITSTPDENVTVWIDPTDDGDSSFYTKSEIDTILANLEVEGGGAGVTMDLLWENPDPTAEFAAQTVELDLSEYTHVAVMFKWSDTANVYVPVQFFEKGVVATANAFGYNATELQARVVTPSDTAIAFGDGGRWNRGSTTSNIVADDTVMIPYRIYGIKNGSSISTSGGIGMDLLWKNDNESAEFAAQNIEIDRDSYDEIVVYTTSGDIVIPKGSTVPYLISQNSFYDYDLGGQTVYGMYSWSREIVTSTDGVLKFADCVGVGGENHDDDISTVPYGTFNHQCKPIAIYGRNLTGATAPTTQTGIQMELLWENASPDSEFAPQTINADIANDKLFLLEYLIRGATWTNNVLLTKGNMWLEACVFVSGDAKNVCRSIIITDSGFEISYGILNGVQNSNSYMKPFRIYAIKGVS